MCEDGGALSDAALQQLGEAGYGGAVRLEGGYAGWSEVITFMNDNNES
jgi:rhodanese-related sulfurtransferase